MENPALAAGVSSHPNLTVRSVRIYETTVESLTRLWSPHLPDLFNYVDIDQEFKIGSNGVSKVAAVNVGNYSLAAINIDPPNKFKPKTFYKCPDLSVLLLLTLATRHDEHLMCTTRP